VPQSALLSSRPYRSRLREAYDFRTCSKGAYRSHRRDRSEGYSDYS
jgi:hypothetical protein